MRTALISGASRGIGLGIAQRLAELGYGLTITARNSTELSNQRRRLLDAGSPQVVTVAGDLTDREHVESLATVHTDSFGTMDALVLNAGVGTAGPIATFDMSRFDKMMEVNLRAPMAMIQSSLPGLRQAAAANPERGARVLAMASIAGVYAERGLAVYSASKAGLVSVVEALNQEESSSGVLGVVLAPGFVATDMSAWMHDQLPPESMIPVSDVVTMTQAVLDLSARSMLATVVMARSGTSGHVA